MSENSSNISSKGLLVSIFKYSIATWANALIYGVALLLSARLILPAEYSQVDIFISTATLIMNICILGLDQSFIRFFNEPPKPLNKDSLFGACFGLSSLALIAVGIVSCVLFPKKVLGLFFTDPLDNYYLALLFINAFMSMVGRYINILYRMDGDIKLYTIESIANQFFSKLFYLVAVFFGANFHNLVMRSVLGMTGFAIVFLMPNLSRVSLSPKILFSAADKQILPYGLALAPTAIMLYLNSLFSKVYISKTIGKGPAGVFSMVSLLANVVALIQAGFATFWSAFIYANYKTEQEKIKQVHDYLTFIIVEFFCVILAFEDIIFIILGKNYQSGMAVFPIMVLVPIFSIIQETTVYGISIAKKPIYDTIGIALSVISNIGFTVLLAPNFGLYGVCVALAGSNFVMFIFRTIVAQRFYVSIISPGRTGIVIAVMFALTGGACVLSGNFMAKFALSLGGMGVYVIIYRNQLKSALAMAKEMLEDFKSKKA